MILALCILLAANGPSVKTDAVDVWELNTVLDEAGKPYMQQHIFWRMETHDETVDYYVADWRMADKSPCSPQAHEGGVVGVFWDTKDKCRRAVRARLYIETESRVDFETLDRARLPEAKRSGLRK